MEVGHCTTVMFLRHAEGTGRHCPSGSMVGARVETRYKRRRHSVMVMLRLSRVCDDDDDDEEEEEKEDEEAAASK